MKTIGLIGGMSWQSTTPYYKIINETVKHELGGLHSAKLILYSVDFYEIEEYQHKGEWDKCAYELSKIAGTLEKAGADFIIICTNTMHKVYDEVLKSVRIPVLHIADMTADVLLRQGIRVVGLLGTRYTMEHDFYKGRLADKGIEVLVPNDSDRLSVHDIIYNELCLGEIREKSKEKYLEIIDKLTRQGAGGVILGCTEIGLLVNQADTPVKLFDTTAIHAEEAARRALK